MKKGVLKNFAKFTGKHLRQSLFFNKVAGPMPASLLQKRLWHRCFPVNFAKFLRTPFLKNTSGGCFWLYMDTKKFCIWYFDLVLLEIIQNFQELFCSWSTFHENRSLWIRALFNYLCWVFLLMFFKIIFNHIG